MPSVLRRPAGAQLVQHLDDVEHLEGVGLADQVRTLPAHGRVGVAALGADHVLDPQLDRGVHDALHQLGGDVLAADLDAGVGGLVAVGAQGPGDARVIEDLGDGLQVLGEVDDLHGGEQDHVFGPFPIHRDRQAGAGLHVLDLHLQGLPLQTHGAAGADSAGGGPDQSLRGVTGGDHALAGLAHHGLDVVAHRADHGAAGAHGAGVVEQRLPLGQHLVGDLLGQADHALDLAPQGEFLLPDQAQGLDLEDGRVLRIPGLDVEGTGLGAESAVHAAREEGRDRGVDLFAQGRDAPFQ